MAETYIPRALTLQSALSSFVEAAGTQAQEHIRPVHRYISLRLVLQGGFRPDEITPHPPIRIEPRGAGRRLSFDEAAENERERTVLGGLKSKRVDVVVCKEGHGPVLAVSVKGTGVEATGSEKGSLFEGYPPADSRLVLDRFFDTLLEVYDLRFPFVADNLPALKRLVWDDASPAVVALQEADRLPDYPLRIA